MSDEQDDYFLCEAWGLTKWSEDPSTKVGAVLALEDRRIASGWNRIPRPLRSHNIRTMPREEKLKLVVHAEMDAALQAARIGSALWQSTLYMVAYDVSTDTPWGGSSCGRCTVELMTAGVRRLVTLPLATAPARWQEELIKARKLWEEAGVAVVERSPKLRG